MSAANNSVNTPERANGAGAWVKIPGLHPEDPNALNYLTLEQIDKLEARLRNARRLAKDRAHAAEIMFKAGTPVVATKDIGYGMIKRNTPGVVVGKEHLMAHVRTLIGPMETVVAFEHVDSVMIVPVAYLARR